MPVEPTEEMLKAAVKNRYGDATYKCVSEEGCDTYEFEALTDYVAMRAAAPEETLSDWIPVSERLPEAKYGPKGEPPITSDDVLGFFQDGSYLVCSCDHDFTPPNQYGIWSDEQGDEQIDPTHWQPLPAPPK